jgi:hypothetical protein
MPPYTSSYAGQDMYGHGCAPGPTSAGYPGSYSAYPDQQQYGQFEQPGYSQPAYGPQPCGYAPNPQSTPPATYGQLDYGYQGYVDGQPGEQPQYERPVYGKAAVAPTPEDSKAAFRM